MSLVSWLLLALCLALAIITGLFYGAMLIAIDERETWFQPLRPVEFEYLDGEVDDGEQ